ncbi:MAG: polymer-forming cytoskeletal protein [Porticoccaceae bacterium]
MIGSTVKILGEIISDENLFIEGEVEGTITLKDNELTIGPSGRIHANINAKNIKIDGLVDGDIVAKEKVVISKSGNVRGNIVAPRVILEDGGRF